MTRFMMIAVLVAGAMFAQQTVPSGRWEGAVQTPNGDLQFQIDIAQEAGKGWIGTITVPAQNTNGLPLTDVTFKDGSLSFSMKAPGDPRWQGTIDKEGKKIAGELTQGGTNMPFSLTRTGDAKIEKQLPNPAISKELEGHWNGTLDANGTLLRLRFELKNEAGAATGVIFSIDQGNTAIPLGKISENGSQVKIEVPVVRGGFEGERKGTQITGTWSQGPGSRPLTLTKAAQ